MSEYLITCVRKGPKAESDHKHIVSVGIGTQQYSVETIYEAIDQGHTFRTLSPSSGLLTPVAKYSCCGVATLRSRADRQWDDNLDNLPKCS